MKPEDFIARKKWARGLRRHFKRQRDEFEKSLIEETVKMAEEKGV